MKTKFYDFVIFFQIKYPKRDLINKILFKILIYYFTCILTALIILSICLYHLIFFHQYIQVYQILLIKY